VQPQKCKFPGDSTHQIEERDSEATVHHLFPFVNNSACTLSHISGRLGIFPGIDRTHRRSEEVNLPMFLCFWSRFSRLGAVNQRVMIIATGKTRFVARKGAALGAKHVANHRLLFRNLKPPIRTAGKEDAQISTGTGQTDASLSSTDEEPALKPDSDAASADSPNSSDAWDGTTSSVDWGEEPLASENIKGIRGARCS
jgi:hypothetical protein